MLKFGLGVLTGLSIYGYALAKVAKDREKWNYFTEYIDDMMGYRDYSDDDIGAIVDGMIRSFRSENKA